MTREEAYEILKTGICLICAYGCKNMDDCDISYCDIRDAVKTVMEEPCDDAISRQAAQEGLNHLMDSDGFRDSVGYVQKSLVRKMLANLSPVQPKILACGEGELNVPDINDVKLSETPTGSESEEVTE